MGLTTHHLMRHPEGQSARGIMCVCSSAVCCVPGRLARSDLAVDRGPSSFCVSKSAGLIGHVVADPQTLPEHISVHLPQALRHRSNGCLRWPTAVRKPHGPKDRSAIAERSEGTIEARRAKTRGTRGLVHESAAIAQKTKGRNQNFSENCSTPGGIQKSLPETHAPRTNDHSGSDDASG